MYKKFVLASVALAALAAALGGCGYFRKSKAPEPVSVNDFQKAQLLVQLPDTAVTPDGMAVAPDGSLVVACPNFASYGQGGTKPSIPARFVRIGKNRRVHDMFECPILAETGRACPMGIEFGPQGELYVVDNQNWATGNGANGEINQGRILRLRLSGDKLVETTVIAKGISHPNGLRYRNGQVYVTVSKMPKVKRPDGLMLSAVYRFPANGRDIQVNNTFVDPNFLVSFITENQFAQYGMDGIVFDSQGNLYVGNFGDGKIFRVTFDEKGNVTSHNLFAMTDFDYSLDPKLPDFLARATKAKMRTTDGMCIDKLDNIYVADFSNNAIAKVTPDGAITVVAQNGDTGGKNGDLNEPGEPIVWNGMLVISNFDAVIEPDKVNGAHESPATLSFLRLQ